MRFTLQPPKPDVVKIPSVAVNEVVLPTTKYTQIDTMKRKQQELHPQATHQTAPPVSNYPPVSNIRRILYTTSLCILLPNYSEENLHFIKKIAFMLANVQFMP